MNNIFPVIIIALYICAAVWDTVNINFFRAMYWLGAAVVNAAVLMM